MGVAHGFLSLEDGSVMVYKTSTEYAQFADEGILWNSFGYDWGLSAAPIISNRDIRHVPLSDFRSPF
jgi:dTDP-4-dehydrorhamnose 3,5-epimerase-like enzyme